MIVVVVVAVVMATDHTNSGIRSGFSFVLCQSFFKIRFSALRMAQIPTTEREKIAKSTDAPACQRCPVFMTAPLSTV